LETPAGSFSFSYDSLGRRTALTFPNGLSSAATFDAASNLSSLAFKDAAATLTSTSYAYDRTGNQVAAISSPSRDNLPMPPSGRSTNDAGNRLLDDGAYQYDYDNKGNLVAKIQATTMEMTTYSWDAEGRLIRVHLPDGTTARYAYDPFGRRMEKSVNGTVSRYLYDASSGAILLEYDGAGAVVRSYTGLGVGNPLMMESGGNAYFYLNDHLGIPQQMVDQPGAVVWNAGYDAYGEAHPDVELVENNLRFPGQYFDEETGLHYNWHRYYDPGTGRYLTPDPIGLAGGINLYSYVQNNPVNSIDPLGLYDLSFSTGFHVPVSPGIAVGPVFSSSIVNYSKSPNNSLSANPIETDVAAGMITDIGVSVGISDISVTGGACAGNTLNLGAGRYAGAQITFRKTQDQTKSIFNPSRYIDGMSIGLGIGMATPVSVSRGLK
jgi:RHS repeat-associated protein